MNEIVQAFTPSNKMKDWQLRFEDDKIFYEQRSRFYDTGCEELSSGYCPDHPRAVGKEPFYNLKTKQTASPSRIYITHHPKKGEWENHKTVEDVINSPLFKEYKNAQ